MDIDESLALELSSRIGAGSKELRPYLEALSEDPVNEALADMLSALLIHRLLHLLRRGSRLELVDESVQLSDFLESEAGERLRAARTELHASWCGFDNLLAAAARRSDRAAVDSILLSHRGRGQKVLELLAERAAPVRRAEIRKALGVELSDSLISHLLRDLEEADLIVRFRPKRSKEVLVELGPVGRDVVRQQVLPAWIELLCAHIAGLTGAPEQVATREEIRLDLIEQGVPSELVARRLAEALARPVSAHGAKQTDLSPLVQKMLATDDGRLAEVYRYSQPVESFWKKRTHSSELAA